MARLSSELVLSLTDQVSGPARGVGRSLDRLEKQNHLLGRSARLSAGAAASMGTAQSMALAGVGRVMAPIAASLGAREVVTQAADFESALTGIQKKAGTTAEQTAKLGEEIKALATSGELAVPIEEIIGAYERGAAAGLPIEKLKQFAALSVKAADAFEMPAEEVGNFAAKLSTSLGLSEKEIQRVFDLTNSLADAGISDEKDIVQFVDRTGASLKTLGLTMDQTLAVGSTLLNLGMTSEVASTAVDALSTKMLTVSTLTGKGKKTFERFMGPVGKFSKMVGEDANGALLTMLDRIKDLNSEDRMEFLKEFVGQDHASKILRMADAVGELRRNQALAADETQWFGSLDKAYALKLNDFWSQWQLMKNSLSELAIDLGTMGMPAFKAGLEGARDLVAEIQAGMKQMELEIDWTAIDGAKTAVGDLGTQLRGVLNMDTSGSTLKDFFRDLSSVINDVAGAIEWASKEATDIAKFVRDPVGEMTRERTDEELARHGVKRVTPEMKERWDNRQNAKYAAENRARDARMNSRNPMEVSQARAEAAALGLLQPTAKPAPADPMASEPAERGGRVGPATPNPVSPTAQPDIVGPVTVEGEAAALKAQELGQRITDAFSVTAAPKVNSGSLDAYMAKVQRAIALTNELDGRSARVGSGAGFDGIHADIED